jgi:hypothetical protein
MDSSFDARALQLAFDLTTGNTYEGKMGQGYVEARAADVRRVFNILAGRSADDHGAPVPAVPEAKKRPAPKAKAPEQL